VLDDPSTVGEDYLATTREASCRNVAETVRMDPDHGGKRVKLGVVSGVYIPVCLNIISILMFLRFGVILGRIGLVGILGRCLPLRREAVAPRLADTPPSQAFLSSRILSTSSQPSPSRQWPPMVKSKEEVPTTSSRCLWALRLGGQSASCSISPRFSTPPLMLLA